MGDVDGRLRGRDPVRRAFVAERGKGLEPGARRCRRTPSSTGCSGPTASAAARRAAIAEVIGELIDASSVGGGTFDLGSATFDMTRVVTGQLDAYVEPGPRLIVDDPRRCGTSSSGWAAARC